jgi:hypothetical protein
MYRLTLLIIITLFAKVLSAQESGNQSRDYSFSARRPGGPSLAGSGDMDSSSFSGRYGITSADYHFLFSSRNNTTVFVAPAVLKTNFEVASTAKYSKTIKIPPVLYRVLVADPEAMLPQVIGSLIITVSFK